MPEIRRYVITETRELKVSANDPVQAIDLARMVFEGEDLPAAMGINVLKPIRVVGIEAVEVDRP